MPLPDRNRLQEYALKGLHLALRQIAQAPEQRVARSLAREVPVAPPSAPRVAILSPRDWAAQIQWESLIGHALQVRGAHVSFMTCGGGLDICDRANTWEAPPMPCTSCSSYVRRSLDAHGFEQDELAARWGGPDDDGWPELDGLTLDQLSAVTTTDGLPLGSMVEIPLKWFLMRTDLQHEPLAAPTWRSFLRSAERIARAVDATLDRIRPDVVLLLNGLFLFEVVAAELCRRRGIDVVTYERGFINDTLVVDREQPACRLDVSAAWEARRRLPLSWEEAHRLDQYLDDRRHGRRTIDQYWKDVRFEAHDERPAGKVVNLFTNLTWDAAVIDQDLAFPSIQDWLVDAIDLFAGRPDDRLVIRIHPAEVKLPGKQTREPMRAVIDERVGTLPPNVVIIDAGDPRSSYPLMEASDLGLVYTSTTGLELALHGVPVIVAGETHYRGKGFTTDIDSPEAFRAAVTAALDDPPDDGEERLDLARRYAHLFFFEAPIAPQGIEEHVLGLVRVTIRSLDELAPGVDPELDRLCAAIMAGADVARSHAA